MSEVIDLLSSDSEDDDVHLAAAAAAGTREDEASRKAARRENPSKTQATSLPMVTQSQEDMYDSDDSWMNSKPAAFASKPAATPPKSTKVTPTSAVSLKRSDHEYDSDESWMDSKPVFARKPAATIPKSTKATPTGAASLKRSEHEYDSDESWMNSKPVFARKPAAITPTSTAPSSSLKRSEDQSASDSDKSLMNSKPVFAMKPAARAPKPAVTPRNEAPRNVASLKPAPSQATLGTEEDAPFEFPAHLPNSTMYEDLRREYILAFSQCARNCVQHSYDGPKLDQLARKIVLLALTQYPIRSLEEYLFSRGVGGCGGGSNNDKKSRRNEIESQLQEGGLGRRVIGATPVHEPRKYFSVAEACLVAMLSEIESRLTQKDIDPRVLNVMDDESLHDMLSQKNLWVSLPDLLPTIDGLLRPECPGRLTRAGDGDNGAAHYTKSSTKSAEFLQIRKLEKCHKELGDDKIARIKRHTRRGTILFELTFVGFRSARLVRERPFPLPPGYYRTSRILHMSEVSESYKNICIGVDFREGGGGKSALHEMCNRLESTKVPYFVAPLKIGDYLFFTRGPSGKLDYLCPILVERKSIEDIAASIHDGRWIAQKQRMYKGQYVFGYENSRMVFIIEGDIKRQELTGGFVGSLSYGQHSQDIEREIANLEAEGFEVLRTSSRDQSMLDLARWARELAKDLESGKRTAQYTYAQFTEELKKIPSGTDFSRLAKFAMERKTQASVAAAASKRAHAEVDYDSEIEILDEMSTTRENPTGRRDLLPDFNLKPAAKKAKSNETSFDYSGLSKKQLEEKCVEYGLAKTGNKPALISRLNGPHPPKLVVRRKRAGQYVPSKHNVIPAAMLVALYLHEKETGGEDRGLTKDELIVKTDELQISKTPVLAVARGPYPIDGWKSMSDLRRDDPPLVKLKDRRFKLTRSSELAGYPIAEAIHKWCHQYNSCRCGAADV